MQKESIDLMNIEYEDVLHLYRGWRKSENLLKDKDKELASLKQRIKSLQDSHNQFRSQIQALESVKELTVTLQSELTTLQQENRQLLSENKELVQLNLQAEELLKEKDGQEHDQSKMIMNVQMEFATLKGRYEETLKIQKELEKMATDEQAVRRSLENRLQQADQTIDQLKEENRSLRQKLEAANHKLNQCDQEILHASEQLSSISRELVNINSTKEALATSKAENGVLRGDIARLLRLLEYSSATKEFIDQWETSEGMHFVGFDPSSVTRLSTGSSLNLTETTFPFDPTLEGGDYESKYDLSPTEFAQLKRIHGRDPFPMTQTYTEESEYWVPKDAARLGLHFISSKFPHASPQVIMDFLRSMNKIWLRRERRKVKKVKEVLGSTIEDLKRQLSHLKPYKGVIAERQIKRLKSQVKQSRSKLLSGRAKNKLDEENSKRDMFEAADIDYYDSMTQSRRLCKQVQNNKHYHDEEITKVSTEKLLEASMLSLETMGKRMVNRKGRDDAVGETFYLDHLGDELFPPTEREEEEGEGRGYPSPSYLRGAIWLGRNMTLLSVELVEEIENQRIHFLQDLEEIARDSDFKRSCHRMRVIATTAINQTCSFANKHRSTLREMLEGVSAIEPGNSAQYQRLLATLPIDSAFTTTTTTTKRRVNGKHHSQELAKEMELRPGTSGSVGMERKSPGRSIRFSRLLDSSMQTADLIKTPK